MGKDLRGKELGTGLYQRADGRYEARAQVNGLKINLYSDNLKQLKLDFENAKADARQGLSQKYMTITMDEWFEEWFMTYRAPQLKASSINPIKNKYKSIIKPYIGHLKVKDIVSLHIQKIINEEMQKGRAHSSLREAIGLLRRCLESAKNNHITTSNPCYDIQVPWSETKKVLRRYLDPAEVEEFLREAEGDYYYEMYYIMLYTGLRVGEVGGLKWSDVDFKKRQLNINQALSCEYKDGVKTIKLGTLKTPNSYRVIPFVDKVEEHLRAWKYKQDVLRKELGDRWRGTGDFKDLVFTTSLGSPVIRHIVESQINKIVDSINFRRQVESNQNDTEYVEFKKVYPHALRHTFCSMCFARNINPKVVQSLMGHANYSTTIEIYTHIFEGDFAAEVAKFDLSIGDVEQPNVSPEILEELNRTRGSNPLD